ncbi:MAG TPA: DUF1800 domain-containing protein [Pyrinomonadaceae bacterium]|jgi:uncharacterized protein (DUF1800 family)
MRTTFSTRRRRAPRALALAAALALLSNSVLVGAAQTPRAAKAGAGRMTEEQRAVHVLNRLAFGARPGDVERVRRMGVEAYVEQQLNPSRVDDAALEARLRGFPTLGMTNSELLAKYPQPGRLLRRLERDGNLPPELEGLVRPRQQQQNGAAQTDAPAQNADAERAIAEAMRPPAPRRQDAAQDGGDPQRRAYRQAVAKYMREQGLESPQRVMYELNASRILRAVYSERQLQEVMVDFWTNHFNVYAQKGADRWFLTSYDRDVIRPNALGNFRDLLEATAKSPAMLFYLDNFQSVSPNARGANRRQLRRQQTDADGAGRMRPGGLFGARRMRQGEARRRAAEREQRRQGRGEGEMATQAEGQAAPQAEGQTAMERPRPRPQRPRRGVNENYARELMELHTLGVDGGYTQKDVQEVARAFTGWTINAPRGAGLYGADAGESRAGTFVFNPRTHDPGEKTVLGVRIPAGGGVEDGRKVLNVLVAHPSTAKFIATKLSRKFVSDDPSPALVARVAEAFRKSNGDIKETLRAVFSSPEFNSAEARRAKIKTPFELTASALRTLGAEVEVRPALIQWVARMGEPLYGYQAPTGYPDEAAYWVNTGALLERLNFSLALVSNRIPGARVDLARFVGDEAVSSRAVDQKSVVERFLAVALQGDISAKSREVLMRQLTSQSDAPITAATPAGEEAREMNVRAARRERRQAGATVGNPEVARIAALVIGSPEFQRQ